MRLRFITHRGSSRTEPRAFAFQDVAIARGQTLPLLTRALPCGAVSPEGAVTNSIGKKRPCKTPPKSLPS